MRTVALILAAHEYSRREGYIPWANRLGVGLVIAVACGAAGWHTAPLWLLIPLAGMWPAVAIAGIVWEIRDFQTNLAAPLPAHKEPEK